MKMMQDCLDLVEKINNIHSKRICRRRRGTNGHWWITCVYSVYIYVCVNSRGWNGGSHLTIVLISLRSRTLYESIDNVNLDI